MDTRKERRFTSDLPVRLIAADIDGTLLNDQRELSEENLMAIHAAQDRGIVFAIASGRFPENVFVMMQDAGVSCPVIASNGARVMDENRQLIARHSMDADAARQVLDILTELGADFFLFGEGAQCASRPYLMHHSQLQYGDRLRALGYVYQYGLDAARRMIQSPVYAIYINNRVPLEVVYQALRAVPDLTLTRSSPSNLEVLPQGVDKALGVQDLARYLRIPMAQVMALGDEENDLSLIRSAGCGVAMGNAVDSVKRAAAHVTDTNQQNGLAKAIARWALV